MNDTWSDLSSVPANAIADTHSPVEQLTRASMCRASRMYDQRDTVETVEIEVQDTELVTMRIALPRNDGVLSIRIIRFAEKGT